MAYSRDTVPLPAKLNFKIALKASTDPIILFATAFTAGLSQARDTPNYGQGAKGYVQRFGSLYANGLTDVMVGEAILPSVLHQNTLLLPRDGHKTVSNVSRPIEPFYLRGDNGKWEPSYSSVGRDFVAGAISNISYPRSNRGIGICLRMR